MRSTGAPRSSDGFTLVELIVVIVVIAILAVIGIPRFLSQRSAGRDAAAQSDLRNLIIVETSLEATGHGLTDDPVVLVDREGWVGSDDDIRVCAELLGATGSDVTLTAWHTAGRHVYTYTRSAGTIIANEVVLEDGCAAQTGSVAATTVWPRP